MDLGNSARAAATAHPICKPIVPGTAEHWAVCASSFALMPPAFAAVTLQELRELLNTARETGEVSDGLRQTLYLCAVLVQMGHAVELHPAHAGERS